MNVDAYLELMNVDAYLTETVGTVGMVVAVIALIITLIFLLIFEIAKIKLFKKVGQKWWYAIVPFYSEYVFYTKICGLHWAYFAAWAIVTVCSLSNQLISLFKVFINAMCFYNLGIRCNKDKIASMIFGGLFPHIVAVFYGYSKIEYNENIEVKQSGVF